ncbi:response regulator [Paraflavisolibacter sp. H34]|uniref:response regulator n=1 Tax=Huijunlia imazamoxiresistens TaxID=3127457 RepID=UPI00301A80CF
MRYILLVDDDADDRDALKEALQEAGSPHSFLEAQDGSHALELLQDLKVKNHLPCLIVLDINMPRMDGRQALVSIQADRALSSIPVVIFSTSSNDADRLWFAGKNVPFFTKPAQYSALLQVASRLLDYCPWNGLN